MRTLTRSLPLLLAFSMLAAVSMPQEPIDREQRKRDRELEIQSSNPVPIIRPQIDRSKIKSEAADLARLAQDIPDKVNRAQQGAVPKELSGELKQIEKLSKRLRHDLNL